MGVLSTIRHKYLSNAKVWVWLLASLLFVQAAGQWHRIQHTDLTHAGDAWLSESHTALNQKKGDPTHHCAWLDAALLAAMALPSPPAQLGLVTYRPVLQATGLLVTFGQSAATPYWARAPPAFS